MQCFRQFVFTVIFGFVLMKSFNTQWIFYKSVENCLQELVPQNVPLKTSLEIPSFTFIPEAKSKPEVFCVKECHHLAELPVLRSGLMMIQQVYDCLPDIKEKYRFPSPSLKNLVQKWKNILLKNIPVDLPWSLPSKWASPQSLIDQPGEGLANILDAMRSRKVLHADSSSKGTQLKVSLTLEGGQTVLFKPKRTSNSYIVDGDIISGPDRHQGEVAAFHLSLLLNMTTVPLVTGRKVSIRKQLLPVASRNLSKTIFYKGGSVCFYGDCTFCRIEDPVCDDGHSLNGAIILWLPSHLHLWHFKHPWSRSYKKNKLKEWELNKDFCHRNLPSFFTGNRMSLMLNFVDVSIFDFLIQNGDRHHITVSSNDSSSAIFILDNGKSFGNPYADYLDVLAPLLQCCRIRRRTYERLQLLAGGGLSKALNELLSTDPLHPILSYDHLKALDRRIHFVLAAINACRQTVGDVLFS